MTTSTRFPRTCESKPLCIIDVLLIPRGRYRSKLATLKLSGSRRFKVPYTRTIPLNDPDNNKTGWEVEDDGDQTQSVTSKHKKKKRRKEKQRGSMSAVVSRELVDADEERVVWNELAYQLENPNEGDRHVDKDDLPVDEDVYMDDVDMDEEQGEQAADEIGNRLDASEDEDVTPSPDEGPLQSSSDKSLELYSQKAPFHDGKYLSRGEWTKLMFVTPSALDQREWTEQQSREQEEDNNTGPIIIIP